MNQQAIRNDMIWNRWYELAKEYYDEHGDLNMPQKYVTKDGLKLGQWVYNQRLAFNGKGTYQKSEEKINKLNAIGMQWNGYTSSDEKWNEKYELAKRYFKHYGNLKIPRDFITLDGINRNENGIRLGIWLHIQYLTYIGKRPCTISKERIEKLESVGMKWDNYPSFNIKWDKKYKLAKDFYEKNGHLKIPHKYVVFDGTNYIKLGNWIINQRVAYKNKKLQKDKIKKLNQIEMVWSLKDVIYSDTSINENNKHKIELEILNLVNDMLEDMSGIFKTKDDFDFINELFTEKLEYFKPKVKVK